MNAWKTAAFAAAIVGAVGLGAAIAPPAHGQASTRAPQPAPRTPPPARAFEVFGARGSQIGVTVRDVEDDDVKAGRLAAQAGIVIDEVAEDSPASKAGLKKGDIVVDFDGERVRSVRQFTRLVQETPAGRKVAAAVMRDGQRVSVTLEPRESSTFHFGGDDAAFRLLRDFDFDVAPPAIPARPVPPAPPALPDMQGFLWRSGNSLGITVGDLSDQLADYFGTKDGVLVTSVADNSAAAKAGIKAGDVITSLNGTDVSEPSDLRRRIQRLQDGDEFTVGVVRDKKGLTLKGKIEASRARRTYRSVI